MSARHERGLWWVKRDLRLGDNDALARALEDCARVLALYVAEPSLWRAPESSALHHHAWGEGTRALGEALAERDGRLCLRVGEVVDVLDELHRTDGFDALYAHEEIGGEVTHARDRAVRRWCAARGVPFVELPQCGVIRGLEDRGLRQPIIRERLLGTPPRPAPARVPAWTPSAADPPWPSWRALAGRDADPAIDPTRLQRVTEADGVALLDEFLGERGLAYSGGISSPNTAMRAGSRLSVHIAWGTLSLRTIRQATEARVAALAADKGAEATRWKKSLRAFGSRLHWHDHFAQRLESAAWMESRALNAAHRDLAWEDEPAHLAAWSEGRTGLPMVDASVRCLRATGFVNFRMRAMLVTTACFGLQLSWRSIQHPLARLFRDFEPGIHYPQVQMQAGVVGINTLRVYNPHKQLLDQDPDARFVREWIPELRAFGSAEIAAYETRALGDYPAPIADIRADAREVVERLRAIRRSAEGQAAAAEVLEKHGSRLSPGARSWGRRRPAAKVVPDGSARGRKEVEAKKAAAKKAAAKKAAAKKVAAKKAAAKKATAKKAAAKKATAKKATAKKATAKKAAAKKAAAKKAAAKKATAKRTAAKRTAAKKPSNR